MASQDRSTYSYVQHAQLEAERENRTTRREHIRDSIHFCAEALDAGSSDDVLAVAEAVKADLLPALVRDDEIEMYDDELAENDKWHIHDLLEFVRHTGDFQAALMAGGSNTTGHPSEERARHVVRHAFLSCVALAEQEGVVSDGLTEKGVAVGFAAKLGIHRQRRDHSFGDVVQAVTDEFGALKSFYTGGTGSGKSAGASSQVWDYWLANLDSRYEFKILDPVGMSVGENVNCYDVPLHQDIMRERRAKHGVPPDITHEWCPAPDTELYVPLTPDLDAEAMPYDTEAEEFMPTPFTIPASDLNPSLVASMIDAYVSETKEQTIRDAFRAVNRRLSDWSLADLGEEITDRGELSEKHKKDALRALDRLQDLGFVRTRACEHPHPDCEGECRLTLDLDEVMADTTTITRFTQSKMRGEFGQFIVVAFLLDRIWELRRRNYGYDTMVMWLRELWEIAPHGMARRDYDDPEEAILKHIVVRLKKFLRKPRDVRTHLIADTQEPNDIEKGVRRRFNRYFVFASNDETLKDIFSWASKSGRKTFQRTLSDEAGQGGIIGGCEPVVGSSSSWGMSPVDVTPPPWHHHDKDNDGNGWHKRVELLNREEFRTHDWPTAVPERLAIDVDAVDEAADEEGDRVIERRKAEHKAEARLRRERGESITDIRENIPENPRKDNPYARATIHGWVEDVAKGAQAD
jgi:hypothetical protein